MGTYINVGNAGFQSARNGEYVDKSQLISVVNKTLFTERQFSCVSRCRRFGKSMAGEMVNAVEDNNWTPVVNALQASEQLLQDTLDGDEEAVARGIDATHDENTSILSYNNENSLACVLSIAYYDAKNDYVMQRELPSGKGFADIVLIPRKNVESPAIVLELRYNKDADSAIDQILRKQYPEKVSQYTGELLLVGINYDKKEKTHECKIQTYNN